MLRALIALAFVASTGCSLESPPRESRVCDGNSPAVSPDGTKIAYHKQNGNVLSLGVFDVRTGRTDWIEDGPGMAAYPTWSPSGALVYTYGCVTQTVYQASKSNTAQGGYGLRIWENGRKRELTTGDTRDYLASVSPDGRDVYFSTTRGVASVNPAIAFAGSSQIASIPFDASEELRIVIPSPNGHNTAVAQPVVSPDGSHVVWAQLEDFSPNGGWSLYGGRLVDLPAGRWAKLTPPLMTALAPCWHPEGKMIAFTGFMPDDAGWGVWVMDVRTFGLRRLVDGENPSFSPDGKWLCYERGNVIYRRPFSTSDKPLPSDTFDCYANEEANRPIPELIVWSTSMAAARRSFGNPGKGFAFKSDVPFFIRAHVRWNGRLDVSQVYVVCDYKICASRMSGILLYVGKGGRLWFSSRLSDGRHCGVNVALPGPGEYTVVGVRTHDAYLMSVNGASPVERYSQAHSGLFNCDLDEPVELVVAASLEKDSALLAAEIGSGWPKGMPAAGTLREEVMK